MNSTTSNTTNTEEQELRRLEVEWFNAYPEGDTATAGQVAADDFVALFPDGKVGNKAAEMEWISQNALILEALPFEMNNL